MDFLPTNPNEDLQFIRGVSHVLGRFADAPELNDPKAALDPVTMLTISRVLTRISQECESKPARL